MYSGTQDGEFIKIHILHDSTLLSGVSKVDYCVYCAGDGAGDSGGADENVDDGKRSRRIGCEGEVPVADCGGRAERPPEGFAYAEARLAEIVAECADDE